MRILALWLLPLVASAAGCPDWSMDKAKNRLSLLEAQIKYHDNLYFNQHHAEISDAEYDQLRDDLSHLQFCFPSLAKAGSFQPSINGKTSCHQSPMGSLKKGRGQQEVSEFLDKSDQSKILLQPKVDGIAIELVYDQGQLISATTRGNGKCGLDITRPIKRVPAIPDTIKTQAPMILHGELFARLDRLNSLLDGYVSARHYVAGHMSRSEWSPAALAKLDFFPWRWVNSPYPTDLENIKVLTSLGFKWPALYTLEIKSLKDVITQREQLVKASSSPFLMDGIVLKLDSIKARNKWGETSEYPHWALAWKFPAKSIVTEVTHIEFTIGRTGRITPIARVKPRIIEGRTVDSVSLGSLQTLYKRDIAIGDQISIQLQGQATPTFNQVLIRPQDRHIPHPPHEKKYTPFTCLSAGPHCQQQFLARLQWLTGKNGLRLPRLTEPILRKMIENNALVSLPDLFTLNHQKLLFSGLGTIEASHLLKALETANRRPFSEQLKAIGLPHIGDQRLKLLLKNYSSFSELAVVSSIELSQTINCPEKIAQAMLTFMKHPEINRLIGHLSR